MRVLLLSLLLIGLSGCQIIYKLPTRQGNVIEQRDLDKLKPGMTRDQVKFVMGTPLAATPFRADRWDYVGYYKSPYGEITQRTVTAFFDGDQLTRLEGAEPAKGDGALSKPDADAVIKADAQDRAAAERSARDNDSDIVVNPDERRP
ncbi:outer membrane protein assembly factor BamE (lipoprotein component of BamABCDE complex) [Panacagrimonas perspica]|uniref:Outer membrane protein assembly factor BamE n=1 Tax=Panacagrimonas perspica TaxID=381431 RepID=A0A4S3K3E5_9GAMM|nr:outer membrane protein assembly factor BamE [Panacagrimonas perspica]TDU31201.1 outer membrane protein assembly factor BamE (lipoprotein component of BamABCDE complex) [Panacagrimonas perspica]THD02557.1 outer membrane protein assembly factor BamE [Panacagrimonas perspica]